MKAFHSERYTTAITLCDASARLGISQTFGLFQDIAGIHAELLGIGGAAMAERGLYWITMRTRIRFYDRPAMQSPLEAATWPAKPGKLRTDRFYRLTSGDRLCAEGRTEWCVLNLETGRTTDIEPLFSKELEFSEETVLSEPYARLRHDFTEADTVLTYQVLPSDVDMGQHMNNVAYSRLLMNTFSVAAQKDLSLREAEILFMSACTEGEVLQVRRRKTEQGYEFGVCHADGKYAALARFLTD